jgi:hypothetical protein
MGITSFAKVWLIPYILVAKNAAINARFLLFITKFVQQRKSI